MKYNYNITAYKLGNVLNPGSAMVMLGAPFGSLWSRVPEVLAFSFCLKVQLSQCWHVAMLPASHAIKYINKRIK